MAATVTRTKRIEQATEARAQVLTDAEVRRKVDRLAELAVERDTLAAKIAKKVEKEQAKLGELAGEAASIEADLLKHASDGLDETESSVLQGTAHVFEVGKCRKVTTVVDKEKARRFLERAMKGGFLQLVNLPLGKLREYLTKPQLDQVLKETHDGPRSCSLKPRKQLKR